MVAPTGIGGERFAGGGSRSAGDRWSPLRIDGKTSRGCSGSRYWFGVYPCGTTNNIPTGVVARCLKEVWGRPTKGRPRLFLSGCRLRRFKRGGEALRALNANVRLLGLDARRARVRKGDVLKDVPYARPPFDLVFLDPPYACAAAEVLGLVVALRTRAALSVGKRNRCRKNVKKGLQFARPGAILD